jgi:predicted  nucleic acid-binding Zn-ribbon protein
VLEQLAALAKIAEIDAQALSADTELTDLPARTAELQNDVERLGELLEAERNGLQEAEGLLQAQEDEINSQSQSLARSKAKSARARTLRETEAVERELDTIRRTMKDREGERDQLREAIEKRRAALDKHTTEYEELRKLATEEKERAEARTAELNKAREEVLAGRKALADRVAADVMRRYERIRGHRGGVGVVAIVTGNCTGCNTSLPPNQVIAVQKAETIEQCPRCQRLLYAPEILRRAEEALAEATEKAEAADAEEATASPSSAPQS